MKKIVRILALAVLAIGTCVAAVQKPQHSMSSLFGFGGPIPMCEPSDPGCSVDPV
jgi:hypothetical protein